MKFDWVEIIEKGITEYEGRDNRVPEVLASGVDDEKRVVCRLDVGEMSRANTLHLFLRRSYELALVILNIESI